MNNYFDNNTVNFEKNTTKQIIKDDTNGMNCCEMQNKEKLMCGSICECPQERVCHRYINYEVPHIIPCNTRIINHHIYRHTYTPCYSCCEENVCSEIYDGRC